MLQPETLGRHQTSFGTPSRNLGISLFGRDVLPDRSSLPPAETFSRAWKRETTEREDDRVVPGLRSSAMEHSRQGIGVCEDLVFALFLLD